VTVSERTGAPLLDPFPDICGTDDSCSSFFEGGEPKFSDGMHLRPQICTASHQISGFFLSNLKDLRPTSLTMAVMSLRLHPRSSQWSGVSELAFLA